MPDKVITINSWLLFGLTIDQHRKAVIILRHTFTYEKKLIQQIIFPQMTHCLNILAKRAQYFFPLNCIPLCNKKMVNNQSMYAYDIDCLECHTDDVRERKKKHSPPHQTSSGILPN